MCVVSTTLAAVLGAHCGATHPSSSRPGTAVAAGTSGAGARVGSNILRGDYAGSESCARCHADIFSAWRSSPMHLMTRLPAGAGIHAPFAADPGQAPPTFRFKDDTARLVERDGERYVDLTSAQYGDHRYRITRVIGGRYREDFAGVEVGGGDARELLLPVSYVFETRSFRLKGYSVLVGERPGLRAGGVWSETCVFCHNTVPYFDALWGELAGPGAPTLPGHRGRPAACRASGAGATRSARTATRCCGAPSPARSRPSAGTPRARRRRSTRRTGPRHPRAAVPFRRGQLRRDRHRLRGVSRRQPRARRRSARAPGLRAAQRVPERAAGGGRRRDARRAGESRLRALPPGSVLALSVHLGRGGAARRQAGGQLDHLGRGARFPAGRLRAPDVVRDLPRPAHRGSPRRSGSAGDDRRQRGLRPLSPAVRAGAARSRPTRTTIRPGPAEAASPATCRRRTWASATR